MGMKRSGGLASLAFYNRIDCFSCSKRVWHSFDVQFCFRFQDDVVICGINGDHFDRYLNTIISRGKYFKIDVESHGATCNFLDLALSLENGRVAVIPFFKPTGLAVPLCSTSAHKFSVHKVWPVTQAQNLFAKSTTLQGALMAKDVFIQRFKKFYAPRWLMRELAVVQCAPKKRKVPGSSGTVPLISHLWIPIDFHPIWERHIQKALQEFLTSSGHGCLALAFGDRLASSLSCRLAWRNMLPSVVVKVSNVIKREFMRDH
jgi:hypothetical protein